MNEIEELFNLLIDAFDKFLDTEEKEIGCLNDKEHTRVLADRNYYSELFVKKSNAKKVKTEEESRVQMPVFILEDVEDDGDGVGNRKRKVYKNLLEY